MFLKQGRRLIKYDIMYTGIQQRQKGDFLLALGAKLVSGTIKVYLQIILLYQGLNTASSLSRIYSAPPRARLTAENDVLEHRKLSHQLYVLVDHADSLFQGLMGRIDSQVLPIHTNTAFIWANQSAENMH